MPRPLLWECALRRDLTELRGVVALALAGGGAGDTDVGESSVILINVHGRLHGAGRRGEGRGGGNERSYSECFCDVARKSKFTLKRDVAKSFRIGPCVTRELDTSKDLPNT